ARAAAEESPRNVRVLETASMAQGLSVAAVFSADTDDPVHMAQALEASRSGAVVRAERDADTDAGPVRPGDWVGLVHGEKERIVAVGDAPEVVAADLVRSLAGDFELLSLYVGADADAAETARVREALASLDLETEVLDGGQSRYPYLIGLE
ncbi:MAG TPA: Dak phosphatase, partial [Actinomycetota bacterium]